MSKLEMTAKLFFTRCWSSRIRTSLSATARLRSASLRRRSEMSCKWRKYSGWRRPITIGTPMILTGRAVRPCAAARIPCWRCRPRTSRGKIFSLLSKPSAPGVVELAPTSSSIHTGNADEGGVDRLDDAVRIHRHDPVGRLRNSCSNHSLKPSSSSIDRSTGGVVRRSSGDDLSAG